MPPVLPEPPDPMRLRIVDAGLDLLAAGGRDALTTRAVAAAAGVQAPAIYRLFGDKDGLLEAVAEHGMRRYLAEKAASPRLDDPVDDLRAGWDTNMAFSLAYPAIFAILNADPHPGRVSAVAAAGEGVLRAKLDRIAAAGLLRVPVERALGLVRAAGVGAIMVLLARPEAERDPGLSVAAREAVIAAITTAEPAVAQAGPRGAAIALRGSLDDAAALSPGERLLLAELLDRLARS